MNKPNIFPAILTDSIAVATEQIQAYKDQNKIRTVHIDIIDGLLVDDVTLTPIDLLTIDVGELSLDFHLMTEEPLDYVYELIEYRSIMPMRAVIGQIERMSSQIDFVETVGRQNWQAGLSLDLFTPPDEVDEDVWPKIKILQLMGVEMGSQNRPLQLQVFAQLTAAIELRKNRNLTFEIQVDGGVKVDNVDELIKAGADSFAVGSGFEELNARQS